MFINKPRNIKHLDTSKWCHPSIGANLGELAENHTLMDVLSALISPLNHSFSVQLGVSSPIPTAQLFISTGNGYEVHYFISESQMSELKDRSKYYTDKKLSFAEIARSMFVPSGFHYGNTDLYQVRWVGSRTIKALADTIRGTGPDIV